MTDSLELWNQPFLEQDDAIKSKLIAGVPLLSTSLLLDYSSTSVFCSNLQNYDWNRYELSSCNWRIKSKYIHGW